MQTRTQSERLDNLARKYFHSLSKAELKLLDSVQYGRTAFCGPSENDKDPANDPTHFEAWKDDRQIRAEMIRWLCVNHDALTYVDPRGIRIHAAKLLGTLDLSFVTIPFPIELLHCHILEDACLLSMKIPMFNLAGSRASSIFADGAEVPGNLLFNNGFMAVGVVRMHDARIGNLDCSGGIFNYPEGADLHNRIAKSDRKGDCGSDYFSNTGEVVLSIAHADITGSVFLNQGFTTTSGTRLVNVRIGGDLNCRQGLFKNVYARGAKIDGGLFWQSIKNPAVANLDLQDVTTGTLRDDQESWPAQGKLKLDGFRYSYMMDGPPNREKPSNAKSRCEWLARQERFTAQPYRQVAKILLDRGDENGAVLILIEMERRRRAQEDKTAIDVLASKILRWSIGYGYTPLLAIWEIFGLSLLGWIVYRRAYLAGSIVPKDKDANRFFREEGHRPTSYCPFSPMIYSLENSLPLVNLGQAEHWQPDPGPESSLSEDKKCVFKNNKASLPQRKNLVSECQDLHKGVLYTTLHRSKSALIQLFVLVGMKAPTDLCIKTSRISRIFTSSRFVRWFLWIQILLGWILATFFAAGVTGIVRRE